MHSISTRAPPASPFAATVERAGGSFGKYGAAREREHRLDVLERLARLPRNPPLGELARSRDISDLS